MIDGWDKTPAVSWTTVVGLWGCMALDYWYLGSISPLSPCLLMYFRLSPNWLQTVLVSLTVGMINWVYKIGHEYVLYGMSSQKLLQKQTGCQIFLTAVRNIDLVCGLAAVISLNTSSGSSALFPKTISSLLAEL
jgi:hypothetical protein